MADKQMTLSRMAYPRSAFDYYPTEPWVTRALLRNVNFGVPIWEPAAGDGAMVKVLREAGHEVFASDIQGSNAGCTDAVEIDFLQVAECDIPPGELNIVTNPPFGDLASEFIERALVLTESRLGKVAMLLRNEVDSSRRRMRLFGECPAFAMKLVLTARPFWFADRRNHPRHNFSWFIWDWRHQGKPTIVYDVSPSSERFQKTGKGSPATETVDGSMTGE